MKRYFYILSFFLSMFVGSSFVFGQTTVSKTYTGGVQTFCVPLGVTSVTIDMAGAQGGTAYGSVANQGTGGLGARVQATLAVTPGTTLNIYVAGAGGAAPNSWTGGTAGWGGNGDEYGGAGGGNANTNWASANGYGAGGGGGGASAIRLSTATAFANDIISAAGGGGVGKDGFTENGGNAGLPGAVGSAAYSAGEQGKAGTAAAGGAATGYGCGAQINGAAGSNGNGGNGGVTQGATNVCSNWGGGGGGGGGHYAGGGGCGGGGGGGYCYTSGAGVSAPVVTAGYQSGNGYVNITYTQATPSAISGTTPQCPSLAGQVYSITAVTGASSYVWTVPAGWTITAGGTTNSITVTTGGVGQNGNITVYATDACGYVTATQSLAVTVVSCLTYKSLWVSMNTGSSTWCPGETRNVTVTVTNNGNTPWTNAAPDVNVGVKWNTNGASWADYYVRVDCNGLTAGATTTYTLPLTASDNAGAGYTTPLAAGTNNITFDIVKEGDCWFGNNNGSCGPGNVTYTSAAVTISPNASIASVTGTSPLCVGGTATYSANSVVLGGGTGAWSSSNTAVATVNSSTGLVTAVAAGTCNIIYTITGGCNGTPSAQQSLTVNAPPTVSNAGPNQNVCNATTATLAGNTVTVGTGAWTVVSGTGVVTTPSSPTSGVTGLTVGASTTFRWTISNAPCTASFSDVIITSKALPTTANAGPNQNLCNVTTTTLAGNTATVGVGAWSVVSGTATITTPSSPTSGVTGLVIGASATLRWSISNSPCVTSTADVIITVSSPSVLGTVSPVGPIDFCNSSGDWTTAGPMTVSGNTGTVNWDYGWSSGGWSAPTWVSGASPAYCCFPKKVAVSDGNADRIRWSVTNGGCPASAYSATILIRNHYNEVPTSLTASANPVCSGTSINLTANFPAVTNISGNVEFFTGSCGGALFATVAGNGTTSVSTTVTPPLGTTVYYARYNPGAYTGCSASACVSLSVTADAPSVLGTASPTGPIDFCDAGGNWSAAGPMAVSGNTGTVTWDWGSSNGAWNGPWVTGVNPGYGTFPKKIAAVDATADRIRWSTKNGTCPATAVSGTILIRNHYNEAPTSLTCSINNVCAGVAGTLTANFPTATNISGNVEFFTGSCAGTLIATVAGNGTTSVSTAIVAPSSSVTYYARYNPGAGAGCAASACVNVTLTVLPATPATPGAITGATVQCPSAINQFYSITSVTNATTYTWAVPAGWTITAGQGTTALTVTTGGVGQNGNITVTAGNSCGTSAASTLAVTVVAGSTPNAGPDQYICNTVTTATMAAVGTGAWTYISGPAGYTITTSSSPTTTITGLVSGTYEFRWTSCGGAYDDMVIIRQ